MDTKAFQRVTEIVGDDDRDTALLREMANEARNYIEGFSWSPPISEMLLAYGVGKVVAIFLVRFSRKIQDTDEELWVVVGDLPSAYLVVEPNDSPKYALERYCDLMEEWIDAVQNSRDLGDKFPVSVEPTKENADSLRRRINFLRTEILPGMPASLSRRRVGPTRTLN